MDINQKKRFFFFIFTIRYIQYFLFTYSVCDEKVKTELKSDHCHYSYMNVPMNAVSRVFHTTSVYIKAQVRCSHDILYSSCFCLVYVKNK